MVVLMLPLSWQAWVEHMNFFDVTVFPLGTTHVFVFDGVGPDLLLHLRTVWNSSGDGGPHTLIWFNRRGLKEAQELTGVQDPTALGHLASNPRVDTSPPLCALYVTKVTNCTMQVSGGE